MSPAERVVIAARACFAAREFSGTTVADIEAAAGYTPRSGGVYRHFPSKVAMLEAVIEAELASNRAAILELPDPPPGQHPRATLEDAVRRGLAHLDRQAEAMRIVFRDLDRFGDLLARVRAGLIDATYRNFADRLRAALDGHPDLDPEALALLAVGPIVDYKVKQHLLGGAPLAVDEDRFVRAWVHLFGTYLGVPE